MSEQATAIRFTLDEAKARAFLARSLRRYGGQYEDGGSEQWELVPGWDLAGMFSDETGHVEDLVYEAITEARAITSTVDGADIDLLIETGEDWMYQWRVSLPGTQPFALCSPYREDFCRLGWGADDVKAKGSAAALGILREAVASANAILAGFETFSLAPAVR